MIFEYVNIFLWFYGAFFALVALFGFAIQRNKERGYTVRGEIRADDITVLIPFRNEEKRLPDLLQSIRELNQFPRQFVFIDDHSEDGSAALIEKELFDLPFVIVKMSGENSGKKYAIREGAKQVDTKYTLTWDADIKVKPDYFRNLSALQDADMYVLPAVLTSERFREHLFSFDVVVANAVNMGLSGWRRPIFASGANLLYKTESFDELDSMEKHGHISSGDDTFLLRDFVKAKADVRLYSGPEVAVYTPAPTTMREYLDQRLRWVSKTNALGDFLNTWIAVKQLILMICFIGLVAWTAAVGKWFFLIYLFVCKTLTDFLVFSSYFKRIGRSGLLLLLPVSELWFPVYSLLLTVLLPFYQPKWKGRKVVSK